MTGHHGETFKHIMTSIRILSHAMSTKALMMRKQNKEEKERGKNPKPTVHEFQTF